MPRSDDAYDLVHTYDQAKAGKSKTSRPAVREIGRDGAAVETYVSEEQTEADVRTPPSGIHLLFFNESGDLRQKDPDGSVTGIGGGAPTDADYVTVSNDGDLSDERVLSASDGLSLSDGGAGGTVTVDAATLQDPSYVTANSETGLDSERTLSTGTGLGLTDNGAGNSLTVDADTLRGEPFVTTGSASSLSGETVAGVLSDVYGSPVEVGGSGTDLRLDTGQSIEDGSGTRRFGLGSSGSLVRDENGDPALFAGSAGYDLSSRVGTPLRVRDREGSFTAVQYDTDSTAGVLRTPNAGFAVENDHGLVSDGLNFRYQGTDAEIQPTSSGSTVPLNIRASLVDLSESASDLRLANGQGIEDPNDNLRFEIQGGGTFMRDETGNLAFEGRGGTANKIFARSGQPIKFDDGVGGFDAIKYLPSSSAPGTFDLANARLKFGVGGAREILDDNSGTLAEVREAAGGNQGWMFHCPQEGDAATSALKDNGMIFSVDETNNELTFEVQFSDGTRKTGTVALS